MSWCVCSSETTLTRHAGRAPSLHRTRSGIGNTVLLETEWVLRSAYDFSPTGIHSAFKKLLGLPQVTLGDQAVIVPALVWYKQGMDFADALHLASASHASGFATFDRALQRSAERITGTPAIVAP